MSLTCCSIQVETIIAILYQWPGRNTKKLFVRPKVSESIFRKNVSFLDSCKLLKIKVIIVIIVAGVNPKCFHPTEEAFGRGESSPFFTSHLLDKFN